MMYTFSFWHWKCRCFGFQNQWFLSCFAISKGESEPNLNRIQACRCGFTWLRGLLGRLGALDSLGRTMEGCLKSYLQCGSVYSNGWKFSTFSCVFDFCEEIFLHKPAFLQLWKKLRPGIVLTASRTARTSRTETNWFRRRFQQLTKLLQKCIIKIMDEGSKRTKKRILLGFTWELPQSLLALVAKAVLKARPLDCNGRFRFVFKSSRLSSFSLGEFIFFNEVHTYLKSWNLVQKHEHGHSIQSRILGPLYLLLIGLPSFTWNLVSQHSDFFSKHYYDTPWEDWANRLVGIEMHD